MNRAIRDGVVVALALGAVLIGALWRFAVLSEVPVHADEATGARIVGFVLDAGEHRYDPAHFHGPLVHALGAVVARGAGAEGWSDLEIAPLRRVTALTGLLLCLLPLAALSRIGLRGALWGTAFLAVNPWLVYYSRIYIHETLLAGLLGGALLAVVAWWSRPTMIRAAVIGIVVALAAATKETWIFTPVAWCLVALALRLRPPVVPRDLTRHLALAAGAFLIVVSAAYTDFGGHPAGLFDFVRTYWSYEVTAGHEKPVGYYLGLLFVPQIQGSFIWWSGTVGLLALGGCFGEESRERNAVRFLFLSACVQVAFYSLLAYKTPWLMLVPVAHLTVAAGLTVARFSGSPARLLAVAVPVLGLVLLAADALQSRSVVFRFPTDARNPLAYVSTAPSLNRWTGRSITWLESVGAADETVAVVGTGYWPLPWYLRPLPKVGYWSELPDNAADMPMVVALPDTAPAVSAALAATHVAVPEGLRCDTLVLVLYRRDIWRQMVEDAP